MKSSQETKTISSSHENGKAYYLLNPTKYAEALEKIKTAPEVKKMAMADSEIQFGIDNNLFQYNDNTRGLSWQIPKLDEWTRSKDYLINSATWRSNQILSRGIDLNIEDHDGNMNDIEHIQSYLREKLFNPLFNIFYLGYFHGGSAGLLIVNGQTDEINLLKPLTHDKIRKGDFLGIKPLTRLYNIQPCYEQQTVDGVKQDVFIQSIGEGTGIIDANELGKPQFYRVSLNADLYGNGNLTKRQVNKLTNYIVHRSHLIIYNSSPLSYIEERIEQFFGPSIGEKAYVAMRRYENLIDQISMLMDRVNIPVLKTKDLARATIQGQAFQQESAERIDGVEMSIAYGNMVLLNEDESFEFANAQFTDIPELLTEYKKQLVAGIGAPSSIALGEFNAKDEHAFDYSIEADSERFLREFYNVLIPLIYRSEFGKKIGRFSLTFKSLEKQTEKEKADTLKVAIEIISQAWKDEVIDEPSYHRMMLSATHNISDMLSELNEAYMEYAKNQKGEDGEFVTYSTKRIKLAEALNRQGGYNIEASKEGGKEGGNNKNTKKPTPRLPITDKD